MILWISLGVVGVALMLLLVVLLELRGHATRLTKAIATMQQDVEPRINTVRTFVAQHADDH